jgi:hypothetical protein
MVKKYEFFRQPNIKPALLLAGRLATASRMVIESNGKTISQNLGVLENVLNEYNQEIISLTTEPNGFFINQEEMEKLLSDAITKGFSLAETILKDKEMSDDYEEKRNRIVEEFIGKYKTDVLEEI